ncbi:MAG TPA: DNA mismatch repair endonuclease MutL [Methylomirabilota bacterium]|nr:DNA mismatch repair endonuclease MutL [Methylomirabilota bacterium]
MNRIRLLSEQVANQIAAGEVVERPASVVKELVENSLDADAKRIVVEIQAGGRSLIRITDDGIGMTRDDALLCLERHATSKIQSADDLSHVSTMGFRGEALPSIASVSRMSITTRERGSEADGTQVVIHGGKILEVKAAGAPSGTCIEIRGLFYNVPARRKFLRSDETERSHIQHYLTLAALAHPAVAFTYVQDGQVVWQLPAAAHQDTLEDRLRATHERYRAIYSAGSELLTVNFTGQLEAYRTVDRELLPAEPLRVWGLIGSPGMSRSNRDEQHLFVNRRPVENRGLNFALLEGYHTALMKGRYPVCCLFLEINPAAVDVNIHPSKKEIKFHHEQAVRRLVTQAVRETLLNFHSARSAEPQREFQPIRLPDPQEDFLSSSTPAETTHVSPGSPAPPFPNGPVAGSVRAMDLWPKREVPPVALPARALPPAVPEERSNALLDIPLRRIGVLGALYVLYESDRGLVLMDQHAAHERILFEEMLKALESGPAPCQRLLLAETVELSPRDAQFVRENINALTRMGVGLAEFGERTFLLDALPPFVRVGSPRQFVLELIDALKATGQEVNSWRLGEHSIAKTVCRHAVKANDPLSGPELDALLVNLGRCEMPYTCPHGRPTLIEMSFKDLEKRFGRVQ